MDLYVSRGVVLKWIGHRRSGSLHFFKFLSLNHLKRESCDEHCDHIGLCLDIVDCLCR